MAADGWCGWLSEVVRRRQAVNEGYHLITTGGLAATPARAWQSRVAANAANPLAACTG